MFAHPMTRVAAGRLRLRMARAGWVVGLVITGMVASMRPSAAEEPSREFVERLRAGGYFDMAIEYLDRVEKMPGVSGDFKSAVALEKAQTHIEAAVSSRSLKERDAKFVAAQDQLKEFLELSSHPRRSEARLQLGKLLLVRADQILSAGEPTDAVRQTARQSYLEAAETFEAIVTDLRAALEEMKGQRIDAAKEPQKAAQRDQYRFEFLQAQLESARAKEMAASTFVDPAKEGEPLLRQALAQFTDLSEKYSNYLQGAQAMLYRAQVQATLELTSEAIDSFQRVLEQPDADPLRLPRMLGMVGLIDLQIGENAAKLATLITQAQGLVDTARPNERRSQELQDLRVALARAYLARSRQLKAEGGKPAEEKRSTTNGRQLLMDAAKVPGTHDAQVKELLASVGVEKADSATDRPAVSQPKSLEEAIAAAREMLQLLEELSNTAGLLDQQSGEGGIDATEMAAQKASIDAQIDETRYMAIDVLRRGLALEDDDLESLNQARQYLAYVLYQRGDYFDAAAVGEFLAHSAPSSEMGLRGGLLALSSLQNVMLTTADELSGGVVRQIERLGSYLTDQWPDDPQAASAKGIMIRLALEKDRWDDARKLLEQMPAGDEKGNYQRLMGQLIWNRSLLLRKDSEVDEADRLLPEAAQELRAGLDSIAKEPTGRETIQAALVLAKIELRRGDPAAALAALDHPKYGPIRWVEKLGEPSEGFSDDLSSTELQSVVGVMTVDDDRAQAMLARATEVMDRLRKRVEEKPDASERLVRIYLALARDIREQLQTAEPARKAKLIGAFRVVLDSIAQSTDDPSTLQWVGQTLMQMGESSMAPGTTRATGEAAELLTSSTQTLSQLIERLGKEASPSLPFQLGRAHRLLGEYKKAVDLFQAVLSENPMMLDAQVEAALAYEQWAAVTDPQFAGKAYDFALRGARPGENGQNVIWGWGKISKMVSSRPEFRDLFFESRYHIALCRFLMGKAMKSDEVIQQAAGDINQVASLYPELGGPQRRSDFDLLLKEIQKSLGKRPEGLTPISAPAG